MTNKQKTAAVAGTLTVIGGLTTYLMTTKEAAIELPPLPVPISQLIVGGQLAALTPGSNVVNIASNKLLWTAIATHESTIETRPLSGGAWSSFTGWFAPTNGTNSVTFTATNSAALFRVVSRPVPLSPGALIWARSGSVSNSSSASSVTSDGTNVVITGTFPTSVNFSGSVLNSAGGSDVFVVKYNSTGEVVWTKRIGNNFADNVCSVVCDASGNIIIAGDFSGTVDFGGTSLTASGSTDFYIAKYSPAGTLIWAKRGGGTGISFCSGKSLWLDSGGNVFLLGQCSTSVTFDAIVVTKTGTGNMAVTAKFASTSGAALWAKGYSCQSITARSLSGTPAGDPVLAGSFEGDVTFGGTTFTSQGIDAFLVKLNNGSGATTWAKQFSGPSGDSIEAICADAGGVWATGNYSSTQGVGGAVLSYFDGTPNNSGGLFIARYDNNGNFLKAFTPMLTGFGYTIDKGSAIHTDASGNVFVTGNLTTGTASFVPGAFLGGNANMYFIAALNSSGVTRWAQRASGATPTFGTGAAADSSGHVIICGAYHGTFYPDGSNTNGVTPLTSLPFTQNQPMTLKYVK